MQRVRQQRVANKRLRVFVERVESLFAESVHNAAAVVLQHDHKLLVCNALADEQLSPKPGVGLLHPHGKFVQKTAHNARDALRDPQRSARRGDARRIDRRNVNFAALEPSRGEPHDGRLLSLIKPDCELALVAIMQSFVLRTLHNVFNPRARRLARQSCHPLRQLLTNGSSLVVQHLCYFLQRLDQNDHLLPNLPIVRHVSPRRNNIRSTTRPNYFSCGSCIRFFTIRELLFVLLL
mmetsp:Transcript_13624/g.29509  ORF Transcript_13624/g.29509 Transcript_13624/m.29509 type:complete len:236 (-) Transcript_13624:285-992(-)